MNFYLTKPFAYLLFISFLISCTHETEIKPEKIPTDVEDLKSLLNKDVNSNTRLEIYYRLYKELKNNDVQQAALYVTQQLDLAEKVDNKMYLGRAYHAQGALQRRMGEYTEAVDSYLQAIDAFEDEDYSQGMAADFNNIGMLYLLAEGYKEAVPYFEKAAVIHKFVGNFKFLSETYSNLAVCQYKTGIYSTAFDYITKAIDIQSKVSTDDNELLAYLYNLAGNIKYLAKDYQNGIEYYNKGWNLNGISNEIKADIAHNLVNINIYTGNFQDAEEWLTEAKMYQSLAVNMENENLVRQYNIEGTFYQVKGNQQKAIEVLEQAISRADKNIINEPLGETLDLLTAYYQALPMSEAKLGFNGLKKIIEIKDQQYAIKDSFYNGMNAKALQAALNKEVEAHNNRKLQASMEAQQWVILRYGIAIVAGLLVLLWVTTRQKRKWALASREWQTKSESLKYKYNDLEFENEDLKTKGLQLTKLRKEFREIFHQITEAVSENEKGKEELKKYDHLFEDDDNQPPKH